MSPVLLLLVVSAHFLWLIVVFILIRKLRKRSKKIEAVEQNLQDLEMTLMEKEEAHILEKSQLSRQNHDLLLKVHNLEAESVGNNRYRQFFEVSTAYLFTLDGEGRFIYANKTFLHDLGYSLNELAQFRFSDLLDELEKKKFNQFTHQAFPGQARQFFAEWQLEDRFGGTRSIALWQYAQVDELENLQTISCVGVEAQFLNGFKTDFFIGESFHTLFENDKNLTLGFKFSDRGGHKINQYQLLFASKSVSRLAELNPFEIEGLTLEMISESLAQSVQQVLETPGIPVFWTSSKNNQLVFLLNALIHEDLLLVQGIDVSQLVWEKQKAEEQRKFFGKILENTPAEMVVFGADERYQYVNSSAVKDPAMRQWLVGKSDSEYLKERSKNFHKAMVRKSRFDQLRISGKDVHFEEFELTRSNTLKHYLRNLTECRCTETSDFFLMTGLDTTDLYKKMESQAQRINRYYFYHRWNHTMLSLEDLPVRDDKSKKADVEPEDADFIVDFFEPGFSFQSFPCTLSLFKESLEARAYQWESLQFQFSIPEGDPNIYLLPHVLIWETLAKLALLHVGEPITVGVFSKLGSTEKPSLLLIVDLQALISHPRSLEFLQTIQKIWQTEGFQAVNSDGCLSLSCPLNLIDQIVNDPKQKPVQILKDRSILIGPIVDHWITKVSDLLQNYGAQVIVAQHHLAIRKYLESETINCIVWKESKSAGQQAVAAGISDFEIPVVWFSGVAESGSSPKAQIPNWRYSPIPAALEAVVELVWKQSAEPAERTFKSLEPASGRKPALVLNFDQLLEITEGDKRFMSSLMDTYFKTLEECQQVFRVELANANIEGLRFLLHKIRATTKTFEIKALEKTILEGIERISSGNALTSSEVAQFSTTMNEICNEVIAQIKAYADKENVPLKS